MASFKTIRAVNLNQTPQAPRTEINRMFSGVFIVCVSFWKNKKMFQYFKNNKNIEAVFQQKYFSKKNKKERKQTKKIIKKKNKRENLLTKIDLG